MNAQRRCGVLMHVTSLPCRHGLGDFGPQAHAFVDFLADAGQSLWQMLPLTPINAGAGNSPYSSYSAFAGNTLFISPDMLVRQGLLRQAELDREPSFPTGRVDYAVAASWRSRLLEHVFDNVFPRLRSDAVFERFCRAEAFWLDDYCLFTALKREHGGAPWYRWGEGLRLRRPADLERARQRLGYDILRERYLQFLFSLHWRNLHEYAASRGVAIIGDTPIYVSLDSCDVWSHRELFELDDQGLPVFCAGAPPDYFSETGQMWGNPIYAWERHEKDGFGWWRSRLAHESRRFDMVRLDHFRGFCGFWQVPACEPTAENGLWIPGPGRRLFTELVGSIPGLSLLAEDLGVITADVTELMDEFGFPGMKILQFAFSPDMGKNAYIPHNVVSNCAVYTGTHDNNTSRGWFARELDEAGRARLSAYAGREVREDQAADVLIRMALGSVARLCVIPMQDYLGLGEEGRMNMPGVAGGNWGWRAEDGAMTASLASRMRRLADIYGRIPD
ncbi:4-alpha-glucanotransferase [Desulfomicrobium escambiense]|uniref:4-alpha-glucanotransferase n=1 Tax=Desulfomicrobium escambiense TaxID=29503 RepID=UPI0003F4C3FB|nr:4-alpha-glucanotransferase [Desulfomicrobium escambiense]